jgi:murein DD-endopeptidase MepM/ murein hydrolase activator NlpD
MRTIKLFINSSMCTALLLVLCSVAQARCQDDWVCVDKIIDGDTIELRARNLRNYPITYTLNVETVAYVVDGSKTVTRTLRPQQEESAMLMRLRDGQRAGDYDWKLDWTVGVFDAHHDNDHLYAFPYAPGRSFRIMQGFGSRFSHTGIEQYAIDFDMPEGTPIHAARSGVVARIEENNSLGCWESGCGKYANFIVVLHSDGTTGEYYHLQKNGAIVDVGDSVARGQFIGSSGNTGHTALPHLHFAVYRVTTAGDTQSVPIRFHSASGIVSKPRRGGRHQAAFQ